MRRVGEPEKWPDLILARTYAATRHGEKKKGTLASLAVVSRARAPGSGSFLPGYNAREIAPLV